MKYFVDGYKPLLNLKETEVAIKLVKDSFEKELAKNLNLLRVSAPLFVKPSTGLNDNLNGYEKAVGFTLNENGTYLEVVQSLAKWKRYALKKYDFVTKRLTNRQEHDTLKHGQDNVCPDYQLLWRDYLCRIMMITLM